MRVFKRPGSKYYYTDFELHGKPHIRSTRLKNERDAFNWMVAWRTRLLNGEVGLKNEISQAPTLREFQKTFDDWVRTQHEGKPGTVKFYTGNYAILLEFDQMVDLPLGEIGEPVIERLKFWALQRVGKTTVNRYLATLRKALRYACHTLKIIDRVPVIKQYPKSDRVEREVDYVFDTRTYRKWVSAAEEPLRSACILARNCGISRVEMLALEKDCVAMRKAPDRLGNWGDLIVKRGLKRRARKRILKINAAMKQVLEELLERSRCDHVFTQPSDPTKPLAPWVLESQIQRLRGKIETHSDAGLHTLRHTFLTEMGRFTDVFTLQNIAGHDSIKTTMRYVHPQAKAVSEAFGRMNRRVRGVDTFSGTV